MLAACSNKEQRDH